MLLSNLLIGRVTKRADGEGKGSLLVGFCEGVKACGKVESLSLLLYLCAGVTDHLLEQRKSRAE